MYNLNQQEYVQLEPIDDNGYLSAYYTHKEEPFNYFVDAPYKGDIPIPQASQHITTSEVLIDDNVTTMHYSVK